MLFEVLHKSDRSCSQNVVESWDILAIVLTATNDADMVLLRDFSSKTGQTKLPWNNWVILSAMRLSHDSLIFLSAQSTHDVLLFVGALWCVLIRDCSLTSRVFIQRDPA